MIQESAWNPMKTAPRDGTTILIRFGQDDVSQGRYVGGETAFPWEFVDTNNDTSFINHAVDGQCGPSHWLPMPAWDAAPVPVAPRFPLMLRKTGSGSEVQAWLNENVVSADGAPAALLTAAEYDVRQERARQDAQWGGPAHDDQLSLADFLFKIADQCEKLTRERTAGRRARVVKITALAVAALESQDRKAGPLAQRPSCGNADLDAAIHIHPGVTTWPAKS